MRVLFGIAAEAAATTEATKTGDTITTNEAYASTSSSNPDPNDTATIQVCALDTKRNYKINYCINDF